MPIHFTRSEGSSYRLGTLTAAAVAGLLSLTALLSLAPATNACERHLHGHQGSQSTASGHQASQR